jgi:glycosyltransferase involved in cell wall biosynthesis
MDSRGGGAERILAQVSGELASRGHEVTLLSFDSSDSPDFYPVDDRVSRIWLAAGRRLARTSIIDAVRRAMSLRRALQAASPDVAVGFMHSAHVPLALAALGTKTRVVASEHIVYDYYADRPLDRMALRGASRLYDRVTVISPEAKRGFPREFTRRAVVIPNPVGAPAGVHADPNGGERKTLLNVGRLTHQKDQESLVRAFALLASKYPDWRLRIIGEGELRSDLQRLVREHRLEDRIDLPGSTPDIWAEYAAAQLFVISSRYESFGIATAEALALGLPAIGFADCPGTNELIEDGRTGLLIDGRDRVAALAAGLDRLMGSAAERVRMGKLAPATVERFALQTVVDRWEAFLRDVRG